jgi:hypothetical protein
MPGLPDPLVILECPDHGIPGARPCAAAPPAVAAVLALVLALVLLWELVVLVVMFASLMVAAGG